MPADAPALDGLVVLDLGHIYQAPYAAFLMAQAGADVIKVEPPGGEPLRRREQIGSSAAREHNREVYGDWLGIDDEELERLRSEGVI